MFYRKPIVLNHDLLEKLQTEGIDVLQGTKDITFDTAVKGVAGGVGYTVDSLNQDILATLEPSPDPKYYTADFTELAQSGAKAQLKVTPHQAILHPHFPVYLIEVRIVAAEPRTEG